MHNYKLSVNQFAAFIRATPKGKKGIIKQQLKVDPILIGWYRTARAAMKKYCKDITNQTPLNVAIDILTTRETKTAQQLNDKRVSILALQELKKIVLPALLRRIVYEIINPKEKSVNINNINIIVAPDVIIRGRYKGQAVIGAIKIHISKTKPFDHQQSSQVASILYRYLTKEVVGNGETVLPELCLCLDIFSGRITHATIPTANDNRILKQICEEVKTLWSE
jgi:hypothetical protein